MPYTIIDPGTDHHCELPQASWPWKRSPVKPDAIVRCDECGQYWRFGTPGFDYEWTKVTASVAAR